MGRVRGRARVRVRVGVRVRVTGGGAHRTHPVVHDDVPLLYGQDEEDLRLGVGVGVGLGTGFGLGLGSGSELVPGSVQDKKDRDEKVTQFTYCLQLVLKEYFVYLRLLLG
eukprot:scaffold5898_cov40-Phaeocystis_antarctica.AAC.2